LLTNFNNSDTKSFVIIDLASFSFFEKTSNLFSNSGLSKYIFQFEYQTNFNKLSKKKNKITNISKLTNTKYKVKLSNTLSGKNQNNDKIKFKTKITKDALNNFSHKESTLSFLIAIKSFILNFE
jgi:hypothetical protein